MSLYVALALCFLPLIIAIAVCVLVFRSQDFKARYSFFALFLGFAAIILIILIRTLSEKISILIPNPFPAMVGVVLATFFYAFIEESVKMSLLFLLPKKIHSLFIFFCVALIMGCAVGSFETLMYLVTGFTQTWTRLFTAVILHALCTALSGFFVWNARRGKSYMRAFVSAVLLHGLYNFFASFTGLLWWFSVLIILYAALRCRVCYTDLTEKN